MSQTRVLNWNSAEQPGGEHSTFLTGNPLLPPWTFQTNNRIDTDSCFALVGPQHCGLPMDVLRWLVSLSVQAFGFSRGTQGGHSLQSGTMWKESCTISHSVEIHVQVVILIWTKLLSTVWTAVWCAVTLLVMSHPDTYAHTLFLHGVILCNLPFDSNKSWLNLSESCAIIH